MSTHKHIDKICLVAALLSLFLTLVFVNGEALGIQASSNVMGYENRLFDTAQVHTIDIVMDDWDSFIETCENEEYAACAVVIDGESYKNVGIRAKGNTSLSNVSSMDSDRYSFKIEFDQYDSTKSYYGLDKLSLNNIIQDSTFMKDYLTYQLMGGFGVSAPLCSYVYITVNGDDWGLYLAVEGVEDAFLQRNYGTDYGELYKPDSMSFGGGRGNGRDFDMNEFMESSQEEISAETGDTANTTYAVTHPQDPGGAERGNRPDMFGNSDELPENTNHAANRGDMGDRGGMAGGMGSSDVMLRYTDDDPNSYSNIFNQAKTDISEADRIRLIESLKVLSEGEDIESVVDIEQVLRYFVVHNFVVNGDSYTGAMIHNYYLYEEDGKLSMIPWDYNLAFGTFQGNNASSAVNDPIDTPLSVTGSGDRPMADWIFANEEYTELYHQYFAQFLESTDFAQLIDETAAIIAPYVEKDPSRFYSYEDFETGVDTLREFCVLREESVQGQLDGTIPATTSGQSADNSVLVDASHITLSDMGSMNMGGGMGGNAPGGGEFGNKGNRNERPRANNTSNQDAANMQPPSEIEQDAENTMTPPNDAQMPVSESVEIDDSSAIPQMPDGMDMPENFGDQMPNAMGRDFSMENISLGMNETGQPEQSRNALLLLAVSMMVLITGLFVAKKYRR